MAKVQQQGQKTAKTGDVAVAEPDESPFRHYIPGEKPRADQAYFELLLLKVLRTGGDIPEFDEVWPRAVQALAGMNLLRLSTYRPSDVRDAIAGVGGEFSTRMSDKAEAIIAWAESMWRVRQIYGSIRQYIRSFETDGFEALLEDMKLRLPGLSPEFLTAYLKEAGEKVPQPEKQAGGRPGQQRQTAQPESRGSGERRQGQPQKQPQPQAPQPEGGVARSDRRRRRGRGGRSGQSQPQQQTQQPKPPKQPQPAAQAGDAKAAGDDAGKDLQQQRRRNRRRFFRRRRPGGGDKGATAAPPAAG
jgi:3-methyladenine DNA glycosylase Tag